MSARQPFFSQRTQEPDSRPPTFVPDPENPLHGNTAQRENSKNETSFPISSCSDSLGNNSAAAATSGRPPTSGLGGLLKKKSLAADKGPPANGPTVTNLPIRPGTSDPHSRAHAGRTASHQAAQLPVMAPIPIRPHSSFLSRNPVSGSLGSSLNAFKIPLSTEASTASDIPAEDKAHISTISMGPSFPEVSGVWISGFSGTLGVFTLIFDR